MVELLQSLLTLTKEFWPWAVSVVGCIVLVWYMRTHIKEIGRKHEERFDKLHEMHRQEREEESKQHRSEREEESKQHRSEREEESKQHREERAILVEAFNKNTEALNWVQQSNTVLKTFIEAKL